MSQKTTTTSSATKRCYKCKEEILADAKKCKHCGADLRSWPVRHKILTSLFLLFVIPPLLAGMFSASEDGSQDQEAAAITPLSDEEFQAALATDKPKVQDFWDTLEELLKKGDDTDAAVQRTLQSSASGYTLYQTLTQAADFDDALSNQIEDIPVPDLADNQSEQMLRDGLSSLSGAYNSKQYAYQDLAKFINNAATSSDYQKMTSQTNSAATNLQMAQGAVTEGIANIVVVMTKYGVSVE